MADFLEACVQGNIQLVKDLYNENPEVSYIRDANGNNALAIAVLSGQWTLALVLIRYCRVSPHAITNDGSSIFHLIPQGYKVKPPHIADFTDIRAENLAIWNLEEEREMVRIQEAMKSHPDLKPPMDLLVKKAEDLDNEMFGKIELFFPKYILIKYHVVLDRNNNAGKTPGDVAHELNEEVLAEYYKENVKPYMVKRRLIQGLNENLVRDIASFL